MEIPIAFDDELARRLPLPLAQLYRRAHNAKGPRDRHDTAYCLWEAALKLLGSTAIVAYAERGAPAPELADRLRNLARPALGHWWEFVRLLVPALADAGDAGFRETRDLILGRSRDDLPRAAGLDAALREALDGAAGPRSAVRVSDLFDRLVRYRNREIGHGPAGQRPSEFYDRMGRALLLGVPELLGRLDVLAGRRPIAVTDVRARASGSWLVERYELIGEAPRRLESLERPESEATRLPRPGRLYLEATGPSGEASPALSLHPLVLYDHEAGEVYFLGARRGHRRAEYLCYYPGRTVERPDLGGERRELLSQALGTPVDEAQEERWAERSRAEEPIDLSEPAGAPRRLGEFELLSELGRGGMGIVYRAWQPLLGRQVALKSLIRAGDPKADARFSREIRALGRVEHPNLVKVFTSGSDADRWFYAMELIEGATLGAVCGRLQGRGSRVTELDLEAWRETLGGACQEARAAERPLSSDGPTGDRPARSRPDPDPDAPSGAAGRDYVRHVVELVRQVAEAAHALHEAGVIHRDIKPDNVLVTPDGTQAVLMDLGLAQLADEAEGRLTRTRQFVGTLRYASPEQVLSVPMDRRTDVYSLGATLWELLTLRPMFGATDQVPTPELMLKIQSSDPDRPRRLNPRVPADLEAIVLKCLEKDRARRYATARELADDLGRWLAGEPVRAQPPTLGYLLSKALRRHRVAVALALLGVITALSVPIAYRREQLRREAEQLRQAAEQARSIAVIERDRARGLSESLERAEKELRLRVLEKVDIANAAGLLERGDAVGSLAWFADAHRLEIKDPEGTRRLRTRLNAALQHGPRLTQILFHDGPVHRATFSPDGRRILTAGEDGTARLWEAATGRLLAPPIGHAAPVIAAEFDRTGHRILTLSGDAARIWDAGSGKLLAGPFHHEAKAAIAAFGPDGRRVLTAGGENLRYAVRRCEVRIWDVAAARLATNLVATNEYEVKAASFSPDGRRVLSVIGGSAQVWDADTGKLLAGPMKSEGESVEAAAFSPDGRRVLTGGGRGTAQVWDAWTGAALTPPMKNDSFRMIVMFSPEGRRILTACDDQARVWDAQTGQPLAPPMQYGGVLTIGATFSPDGRRVLTSRADRTGAEARIWDAQTGQPLAPPMVQDDLQVGASFDPDGRRILLVGRDGTVRVWDIAIGQPLAPPIRHDGLRNNTSSFSPDSHRVLTASTGHEYAKEVRIWDADSARLVAPPIRFPQEASVEAAAFSPDGHRILTITGAPGELKEARIWDADSARLVGAPIRKEFSVEAATFSPDGRRVLIAGGDYGKSGEAWICDADTGRPLTGPMKYRGKATSVAFSRDGDRLLAVSSARGPVVEAQVWDAHTGQPLTPPMTVEGTDSLRATFSPDGRRILTTIAERGVGIGGEAQLWDAATGRPLTPPMKHERTLWDATFSRDGRRIFTASGHLLLGGELRVWDAATGQSVFLASRGTRAFTRVSLSPDGHRILTTGGYQKSNETRIWDADTGQPLAPPMKHDELLEGATFSPDGRRILTAGRDGTLRVWEADPVHPIGAREDQASDLRDLARLLSGRQVTQGGDLVPLARDEVRRLWRDLRPRYPDVFACSPQEVLSWHRREAAACEDLQAWDWAVRHLDALIEADPESWMLLGRRGRAYARLGRWQDAITDASKAIDLGPGPDQGWRNPWIWVLRGNGHAEEGLWKDAIDDFTRGIEADADDPEPRIGLALAHLAAGEVGAYRRDCTRLLEGFGPRRSSRFRVPGAVPWTCVLAPGAVEDLDTVLRYALVAKEHAHRGPEEHASLQALGAVAQRAGAFEEALGYLDDAMKALPGQESLRSRPEAPSPGGARVGAIAGGDALDWLFLAMANHRLGRAEEARRWLDRAVGAIDQDSNDLKDSGSSIARINWRTRLYRRVLRREAEDLIGRPASGRPKREHAATVLP